MIIGNQELAHAPLIVEAYKTIPAKQVAKLLELYANDDRRFDERGVFIRDELCAAAGIEADEKTRSILFGKIQALTTVFDEQKLRIFHLSKPELSADEKKLAAIQNEVFEHVTNETDGAHSSPTRYYTHYPIRMVAGGTSYPHAPQPLPTDWAPVTIAWPATKTVQVEWGETHKQILDIPATEHGSGLFFAYADAAKLQKILHDPRVKQTMLLFGYAGSEPLLITPKGEERRGLSAFYGAREPRDKIRKTLPLHNGPSGGGL